MNFKNTIKGLFVVSVILVLSVTSAMAQDLIVKQDGESIKAYRTDIGKTAVYYQLEDNDGSPILSIPKSEVMIIKMQDGTKIVMDDEKAQPEVVDYYPKEPVADPEMIAKAKIGSLIDFYDGTQGVVFYLDGDGHGLAVHLQENLNDKKQWQEVSRWQQCVDIEEIPNREGGETLQISGLEEQYYNAAIQRLFVPGLGKQYCDAAIQQIGLEKLPAIQWCRSIGPDWYLPSIGELYQLLMEANEHEGGSGPISKALIEAGGYRLIYNHCYFSSSESDNTDVYAIYKNEIEFANKYSYFHCRAIRMF